MDKKTVAALVLGKTVDPDSLLAFLSAVQQERGKLAVVLANDLVEKFDLAASSISFRRLEDEVLQNQHNGLPKVLTETLKAFPETDRFIAINSGNRRLPSPSKINSILNSRFDFERAASCIFISRKYAEHIISANDPPSMENARSNGFLVPSLVSGMIKSPRETIEDNKIIKFGIVGASGVVINYLVVGIFKLWIPFVSLVLADALGIEISIVNNFIWNDRYTFSIPRLVGKESSFQLAGIRFIKYNLVSLLSTFVNLSIFYYLNTVSGIYWAWSLLVAILSAFVINYLGSSRWAWGIPRNIKSSTGQVELNKSQNLLRSKG